jgi:hypothetical protein
MTLYKVLHEDGSVFHGGNGTWPLPKNGKPGAWLEVEGELRLCKNDIHTTEATYGHFDDSDLERAFEELVRYREAGEHV